MKNIILFDNRMNRNPEAPSSFSQNQSLPTVLQLNYESELLSTNFIQKLIEDKNIDTVVFDFFSEVDSPFFNSYIEARISELASTGIKIAIVNYSEKSEIYDHILGQTHLIGTLDYWTSKVLNKRLSHSNILWSPFLDGSLYINPDSPPLPHKQLRSVTSSQNLEQTYDLIMTAFENNWNFRVFDKVELNQAKSYLKNSSIYKLDQVKEYCNNRCSQFKLEELLSHEIIATDKVELIPYLMKNEVLFRYICDGPSNLNRLFDDIDLNTNIHFTTSNSQKLASGFPQNYQQTFTKKLKEYKEKVNLLNIEYLKKLKNL